MKEIALIPFVCGAGASTAGCELGPLDLKQHGLHDDLTARGFDADWYEDPEALYDTAMGRAAHENLPPLGSDARKDIVLWHCAHLRDCVARALRHNKKPVTIGGDHAMAAGSLAGLAQARQAHGRIGLIWIDAHADINTPETSPSGALHGMPIAALLGRGDADLAALGGGPAVLRPEHICYIGTRDIDPEERRLIDRKPINEFTMETVRALGIEETFRRAMACLEGKVDHLALSLDLDAFDPPEVPATGTPVAGGFTSAALLPVLRQLVSDYNFELIELTEYNPTLSGTAQTRDLARRVLAALLPQPEINRDRIAQG